MLTPATEGIRLRVVVLHFRAPLQSYEFTWGITVLSVVFVGTCVFSVIITTVRILIWQSHSCYSREEGHINANSRGDKSSECWVLAVFHPSYGGIDNNKVLFYWYSVMLDGGESSTGGKFVLQQHCRRIHFDVLHTSWIDFDCSELFPLLLTCVLSKTQKQVWCTQKGVLGILSVSHSFLSVRTFDETRKTQGVLHLHQNSTVLTHGPKSNVFLSVPG
jgi:hypothetical protein